MQFNPNPPSCLTSEYVIISGAPNIENISKVIISGKSPGKQKITFIAQKTLPHLRYASCINLLCSQFRENPSHAVQLVYSNIYVRIITCHQYIYWKSDLFQKWLQPHPLWPAPPGAFSNRTLRLLSDYIFSNLIGTQNVRKFQWQTISHNTVPSTRRAQVTHKHLRQPAQPKHPPEGISRYSLVFSGYHSGILTI